MRSATKFLGLAAALGLGACAVPPPPGPTVMALPGQGKSPQAFQQDEYACEQYATGQTGGASPTQAANNSAVGSAVVGTALGAAAGAALGSVGGAAGAGAAIGGATGLLAGSAIGANNAQASGYAVQQRYNMAYTQCMYSRGNTVQAPPSGYAGYPAGPGYAAYPGYAYPGYAYPPPAPYYPYGPGYYGPAYGPSLSIGIGGGFGGDDWHRHHWH